MPALKNQRHEAFAQALAKGVSRTDAYRKTYGTKAKNPGDIASRLSEKVRNRVAEIQSKVERKGLLTMQERRDLIATRARRKTITDNALATLLRLDAALAGELIDRQDLTTDGEALPSAAPVITMTVPGSFIGRRAPTDRN